MQPSSYGCEECLRTGTTWHHLRICLPGGHVGCCDTSEHKHARRHAERDAHPLIGSLQPGEDRAYCFPEDLSFGPR